MAGDWIKMRLDLVDDPAVIWMAKELGVRQETIVGYCHKFWSWVSRHCHAGSVTHVTLESLGCAINLPGFPELLCQVGWLKCDNSGAIPTITIPHFERHLSESAKNRALAAERQRHARVTKTSRTQRDKRHASSVTREEKRREEDPPPTPPGVEEPPSGDGCGGGDFRTILEKEGIQALGVAEDRIRQRGVSVVELQAAITQVHSAGGAVRDPPAAIMHWITHGQHLPVITEVGNGKAARDRDAEHNQRELERRRRESQEREQAQREWAENRGKINLQATGPSP